MSVPRSFQPPQGLFMHYRSERKTRHGVVMASTTRFMTVQTWLLSIIGKEPAFPLLQGMPLVVARGFSRDWALEAALWDKATIEFSRHLITNPDLPLQATTRAKQSYRSGIYEVPPGRRVQLGAVKLS
ncbi:hypothetical protein OE88DRAFT_1645482 [Heliocybe sulcata]|uniref:Uncharacterized protein n=1 Tax=Heliocybe sulcata TaxID=5364 RepID=A0A5C3MYK9_9AGAM|nr:hypothetical protein OE88DRAFT_1645482 [Heliocybe sulcata]